MASGDNPELRIVIEGDDEGGQPKPSGAPGAEPSGQPSDLAASIQRDLEQFKQYQQRLIAEQSRYATYKTAVRAGGIRDPAYEASAKQTIESIKGGMEAIGDVFKGIEQLARSNIPEAANVASLLDQFRAVQIPTVGAGGSPPEGPRGPRPPRNPRQIRAVRLARRHRAKVRRVEALLRQTSLDRPSQGPLPSISSLESLLGAQQRYRSKYESREAKRKKESARDSIRQKREAAAQAMWNRRFTANRMRAGATVLQTAGAFMGRGGRISQIASLGMRGAASFVARGGGGGAGIIGGGLGAGGAAGAAGGSGALAMATGPIGIGIVAGLAAGATALGTLTMAVDKLAQSINEQSARYGPLSSDYVGGQLGINSQRAQQDFRRAQRIGPALNDYAQQRFKLEQGWEDVKANLTNQFEPAMGQAMGVLNKMLDGVNWWTDAPRNVVDKYVKDTAVNFGAQMANGMVHAMSPSWAPILSPLINWLQMRLQRDVTTFDFNAKFDRKMWDDLFKTALTPFNWPNGQGPPAAGRNRGKRRHIRGPRNIH